MCVLSKGSILDDLGARFKVKARNDMFPREILALAEVCALWVLVANVAASTVTMCDLLAMIMMDRHYAETVVFVSCETRRLWTNLICVEPRRSNSHLRNEAYSENVFKFSIIQQRISLISHCACQGRIQQMGGLGPNLLLPGFLPLTSPSTLSVS